MADGVHPSATARYPPSRADRALRGVLEDVARDRTSVTAAKTKLALYLLDGIKVDKDIRKMIENL